MVGLCCPNYPASLFVKISICDALLSHDKPYGEDGGRMWSWVLDSLDVIRVVWLKLATIMLI